MANDRGLMGRLRAVVDMAMLLQVAGLLLLAAGLWGWLGWALAAVIVGAVLLAFGTTAELLGLHRGG
jgi:fatty acid desaturase